MTAKSYLKQIERLDTIINNKLIEKAQWRAIALSVTAHSDGERVQSSGNKQKMADAVNHCIDVEAEIDSLIDRLIDLKKEITAMIEQLNPTEYDVLHKIYIQHLSFYDVADAKGKTYSWVTTVHGRALKNLRRLLKEKGNAICDKASSTKKSETDIPDLQTQS